MQLVIEQLLFCLGVHFLCIILNPHWLQGLQWEVSLASLYVSFSQFSQPRKVPFFTFEPHCTASPFPGGHIGHFVHLSPWLFESNIVNSLVWEHLASVGFIATEMNRDEAIKQNPRMLNIWKTIKRKMIKKKQKEKTAVVFSMNARRENDYEYLRMFLLKFLS